MCSISLSGCMYLGFHVFDKYLVYGVPYFFSLGGSMF